MPTIFPVYIFKGDETYLKKKAVENLKKALLEKGSEAFNFNVYDIGKCDLRDVLDTLRSAPFISGKRLVVIRAAAAASEKEKDMIVEYAKNPSKNSCLIIDISKDEMQNGFYGTIRRYTEELSFTPPKGDRMASWIQKEVKERGKSIRHDAAVLLGEIKEEDTDGLINEIDKLTSYVGERPAISKEDIEAITGGSAARNVFDLADALSKKDAKAALIVSNELLKTKKPIPEILGMIGWQLRKMKRTKDSNVFTQKGMNKALGYLLDADYAIKTGQIKPQDALLMLIIRICAGK